MPGSLILIGGDPGIGKSTLLLQVSAQINQGGHRVLYISGEESASQIKLRAERLGVKGTDFYIADADGTVQVGNDFASLARVSGRAADDHPEREVARSAARRF